MFDFATRPQPEQANAGLMAAVPFDWRLAPPTAPAPMPWSAWATPDAQPQRFAEVLATYSLACEDTLATAVVISLFTDARAEVDDLRLLRPGTDRRGWVGDEFMPAALGGRADEWGSRLWLCYGGKVDAEAAGGGLLGQAQFAAQEALAWIVRDQVASAVDVQASWAGPRGDVLAIRPMIYQGGASAVYDVLWGTGVRRALN